MDEVNIVPPQTRSWLMDSVLGPYAPGYCSYLLGRRYAVSTARIYVYCVAHFAHWATAEQLGLDRIDEMTARRFLADHLPKCDCPAPVRRMPHEIRAALSHLFVVLRASGAIAAGAGKADPLRTELAAFDRYMDQVGGLAATTREGRVNILRRFLVGRFGSGPIVASDIAPDELRRFVLGRDEPRSAGTVAVIGGALRCYLRFRALSGDRVEALLGAIPSAAHWRLAALPETLSEAEVEQMLHSFDPPFPSSRRAYAMVRCLVDLGLRAAEVVALRLEDIDWHAGTLRLAASKSRRVDILPLPAETGRAIADYLQAERPQTANRAVFVRHVAPYDEPIGPGVVRRAARDAYRRCGWTRSRVHILRHSMASRLLRAGTPLKEVADVLRHRSLDTSAIYAKVDVDRLAAVASPWPGRTP
ncbi:tyrosine-type recombinase/integrase (plasmid) [Skermanella rosea]|uniref:tyrosine-type recombinase/integrase n=1 Tax=Skermanella rosea TaxID=1817965 RepID=UPI0019316CFB|nr:tyrosine-type recombinase/integrase [Skermanella rosea]UEM07201.1 tyrosine-type recombinase/integrase [Skermanella rosea]